MRLVKQLSLFLAAWFILSVLMTGCVCVVHSTHTEKPSPVYVAGPPPEPKADDDAMRPRKPAPGHIWLKGYWAWNEADEDWEWEDGKWEEPPSEDSEWEEPKYEDHDGDWVFVPGHWKKDPGAHKGKPDAMKDDPMKPRKEDPMKPRKEAEGEDPMKPRKEDPMKPRKEAPEEGDSGDADDGDDEAEEEDGDDEAEETVEGPETGKIPGHKKDKRGKKKKLKKKAKRK